MGLSNTVSDQMSATSGPMVPITNFCLRSQSCRVCDDQHTHSNHTMDTLKLLFDYKNIAMQCIPVGLWRCAEV